MERVLKIEDFRNMGVKDGKPCATELLLNESAEEGHMGNLLTVVGANNAGKSNLLDAIEIFSDAHYFKNVKPIGSLNFASPNRSEKYYSKYDFISFGTNDVTDLYFDKECKSPSLSLLEREEKNIFVYKKALNKQRKDFTRFKEFTDFFVADTYGNLSLIDFDNIRNPGITRVMNKPISCESVALILATSHLMGKIIRYQDKAIRDEELEVSASGLDSSKFYKALFHATDTSLDDVKNALDSFLERKDKNIFVPIKNQINEGLKAVSEKFNQLYMTKKFAYSFEVDFDRMGLYLTMKRNGNAFVLSKQSEGFRYFFDLFFNLLNTTTLESGDIIIMDEPALNLHVKGQRELREFLKEFAIRNDILIIIATHSPFLIDTDNLDDIRLVVSDGAVSRIENNFAAVDPNDPDSLLPIKDALTVENHILVDPDEKIVFVEGITDYNYLTAFKKLFGKTGITFLPINGVGEDAEECKEISKKLIRIRKHNPILLVDNDKAGQQMKNVNKESELEAIALSDIDSNFKTIESLFSQEDLNTFGLLNENGKFVKHASTSTVFKNMILKNKDSISDNTKANFRKVFDWIENC
ncbi:MAG: ATP-binding protein [Treponema sp.]|nr:ATP-binding protein [Treponema sp.]MBR4629947.1 ATP-binding protein [Treponema sp.]